MEVRFDTTVLAVGMYALRSFGRIVAHCPRCKQTVAATGQSDANDTHTKKHKSAGLRDRGSDIPRELQFYIKNL